MVNKTFSLGWLTVRLEADEAIEDSAYFKLFQTPGAEPDCVIRVKRGPLPQPEGPELLRTNHRRRVLAGGSVYDYTCFSDAATLTHIPYACALNDGGQIGLTVDYEGPLWDTMLFDAVNVPDLMLQNGAGLLHAAFVTAPAGGILFAGPKQQGKTTQARLWRQCRGARILNGDRAAVRVADGRLLARSVPFCGSSKECENGESGIRAVVFPEKAAADEATELPPFEAFKRLIGCLSYTGCDAAMQEQAFRLAEAIVNAAPCFILKCTKDEGAVEALEKALSRH